MKLISDALQGKKIVADTLEELAKAYSSHIEHIAYLEATQQSFKKDQMMRK